MSEEALTPLEEAQKLKALTEASYYDELRRKTELETKSLEEIQRKEDASLDTHRIYPFNGGVSDGSAQACIAYLGQWAREDPGKPITIVFNSPGGGVKAGLALFDFIRTLRENGTPIDTEAIGWAASMGGVLLQAGETRTMGRHAYMLIHEVQAGAIGNVSELEDELKYTKRLQSRLLDILSERAELTKRQIARRWKRKDWWLDADEALEHGFVDRVA